MSYDNVIKFLEKRIWYFIFSFYLFLKILCN
jgi:hypothetical protein